jgi:hypothetical protein
VITKISEEVHGFDQPSTWSIWVTEKDEKDAPPIVMARGRTLDQLLALIRVLFADTTEPEAATASRPGAAVGAKQALRAMLAALDGWIQGSRENHDASDHRGERSGDECWKRFETSDIRHMVNDVAREMGISEFPYPKDPPEDKP